MTVNKRVILVTGAGAGIGLEAVKALAASHEGRYDILLTARRLERAQAAVEDIACAHPDWRDSLIAMELDIESDGSIEAALAYVKSKYGRLDVLVNNAGILPDFSVVSGELSLRAAWNKAWDVNVTSAEVMTHMFAPLLLESNDPRLLFITSSTSTLVGTENEELPVNKPSNNGWPKTAMRTMVPSYRSSKTGLNMMMREWHRMLRGDGVKVWAVSPGFLATKLGGDQEANKKMGAGDPALGGALIRDIIEGARDGDVGKVVSQSGIQPW